MEPRAFDLAVHEVLAHGELSASGKLLAISIAHMHRMRGYTITQQRLCRRAQLTPKTVRAHLRELERHGIIEIEAGQGREPDRYRLLVPQQGRG